MFIARNIYLTYWKWRAAEYNIKELTVSCVSEEKVLLVALKSLGIFLYMQQNFYVYKVLGILTQ